MAGSAIDFKLVPPTFADPLVETAKNEVIEGISKHSVKFQDSEVPVYFDWNSITTYSSDAQWPLLCTVKRNLKQLFDQINAGMTKVDETKKPLVAPYVKVVAIRNTPGKLSASKKVAIEQGVLAVTTIFEESMNCAFYLESKIVNAFNDFKPPADGASVLLPELPPIPLSSLSLSDAPASQPSTTQSSTPTPSPTPTTTTTTQTVPPPTTTTTTTTTAPPPTAPTTNTTTPSTTPTVAQTPAATPTQAPAPAPNSISLSASTISTISTAASNPPPTTTTTSTTSSSIASSSSSSSSSGPLDDSAASTTTQPARESELMERYPIPTYDDPETEGLKNDVLEVLKAYRLKLEPSAVGGEYLTIPFVFDWDSISAYTPPSKKLILRSMKSSMKTLMNSIGGASNKVELSIKQQVHNLLLAVVIKNIYGKNFEHKKALILADGRLIVCTIFEDTHNCAYPIINGVEKFMIDNKRYYMDSKIDTAFREFCPPTDAVAPIRDGRQIHWVEYEVEVRVRAVNGIGQNDGQPDNTNRPKAKGRPEMNVIPSVTDEENKKLIKESQDIVKTQTIRDETGAPVGAPVFIDWKSVIVYSDAAQQKTVLQNVHANVQKLSEVIIATLKSACADPLVRKVIGVYLRSATISHVTGTEASSKKVEYKDGHLTLFTTFEDAENCATDFEDKIATELGVKKPAASSEAANTTASDSTNECKICLTAKINTCLIPCGHLCVCSDCAEALKKDTKGGCCPICRKKIENVVVTYQA